ncbi:MAG TPA: L-histidine N(alpha)-methyltransferase [Longimicrobiales bacterium]|nr:L-histidine N(alpha)-methyltransferase [Longimicrobiales bacterium]
MIERAPDITLPSDPHDREAMLHEVLEGLSRPQKEVSSKYFYDARGSELFERITELDEYYLTRTERALLERWMGPWVARLRPAGLVELGAGSAAKTRIALDAMTGRGSGDVYVPVDVSGDFLHATAERLRAEYPGLRVEPEVADFSGPFELGVPLPEPTWFALLGSTIGNFPERSAVRLVSRVAGRMRGEDRFLLGVDLRPGPHKSVERLEAAYDDAEGVTAAFNLNVLEVLNRELGADFDPAAFRHVAFYSLERARIEMHLEARAEQVVRFEGGEIVRFAAGETVRTEISCKHDRASVRELFAEAGLEVDRWVEDPDGLFALALGRVAR